jgi:hypothetical protein
MVDEVRLSVHYLGTTTPNLTTAAFRLVWIAPDGRTETPALPGTIPLSQARLIPSTSWTSWLPPTFSLLQPAACRASLLASSFTFTPNSTSINASPIFPFQLL